MGGPLNEVLNEPRDLKNKALGATPLHGHARQGPRSGAQLAQDDSPFVLRCVLDADPGCCARDVLEDHPFAAPPRLAAELHAQVLVVSPVHDPRTLIFVAVERDPLLALSVLQEHDLVQALGWAQGPAPQFNPGERFESVVLV